MATDQISAKGTTHLRSITTDNDHPQTKFTRTTDTVTHETHKVSGNREHVEETTHTDDTLEGDFDRRVMELVNGVIKEREDRENERANKRNFNRMITLLGALLIGLVVTFTLSSDYFGHVGKLLAPYSFVITIIMDSGLALYGYIKKY